MSENNRMRLLWAGFMAILAAGVGFAIPVNYAVNIAQQIIDDSHRVATRPQPRPI